MSNSETFRWKVQAMSGRFFAAVEAFWSHPNLAVLYPEFLFSLHCLMRASVPLMEAALERSRLSAETDPVSAALVAYFAKHIPEERHHDDWLLDDLEVLGLSRDEILNRLPSSTIASISGAQYYYIFHYHPIALLGYIGVLEGYPPSAEHLEEISTRTGLAIEAFRTYLKHAQLDPYHKQDLDRALDAMPLTREQQGLIGVSAIQTLHAMARAFEEIVALHDEKASRSGDG